MAVTIPASDLEGTKLNGNVSNIQTLITANPNNTALLYQLVDAQTKLTNYLVAQGYIVPATVLAGAAPTYVGNTANNQPI